VTWNAAIVVPLMAAGFGAVWFAVGRAGRAAMKRRLRAGSPVANEQRRRRAWAVFLEGGDVALPLARIVAVRKARRKRVRA
jgi:hypothetical protein